MGTFLMPILPEEVFKGSSPDGLRITAVFYSTCCIHDNGIHCIASSTHRTHRNIGRLPCARANRARRKFEPFADFPHPYDLNSKIRLTCVIESDCSMISNLIINAPNPPSKGPASQ
jgi:hypothetical protein